MTVSTTAAAAEVADTKNVFERILRMAGRSPVRVAAVFALTGRLLFSAIAAVYVWHLKLDPLLVDSNQFAGQLMRSDGGWRYALLGAWERFDTVWYVHLAQSGYDHPAAIVFYPLYPLLIALTHLPALAAALLVSTVSSFLFAWGFQKLIQLDYPAEASVRR